MAFVQKRLEDDETLTPIGGGGGIIGAGAAGAAPVDQAPSEPASGSGFVNLRQYLEANKPQSGQMAGQIADTLKKEAQGISGDIETVGKGFQEAVSAKNPINQTLIEEAKGAPVEFESDQAKADAFKKMVRGRYEGPGGLEEYDPYFGLKGRVEAGERQAGLTETEPGRFELLAGLGGPQRTRGETSLDQYLISGSPENIETLRSGGRELAARRQALEGLVGSSADVVGRTRGQLGDVAAQIQKQFVGEGGVVPGLGADLQSRYQAALGAANPQLSEAYKNAWEPVTLETPNGLKPEAMQAFFKSRGIDLSNPEDVRRIMQTEGGQPWEPTIRKPAFDPGVQKFARSEDYAREAALERLLGQEFDVLPTSMSSQAGSYEDILQGLISAAPEFAGATIKPGTWSTELGYAGGKYPLWQEMIRNPSRYPKL